MRGHLLAAILSTVLAGCGNDAATPADSGGAAGAGGNAGAAGSGGSAGAAPCSEDPSTIPPGAVCVTDAHGTVVDAKGAPVSGLSVSVCGPICFYAESDTSGAFSVSIGMHLVPELFSSEPHGRPDRTSFYYPLPPIAGPSLELGQLRVLDLPPTGPALVVQSDGAGAPAQTVTSGDVTLEVADGVAVALDVEDIALGDKGKSFRTVTVPDSLRDEFADPGLGLVALYALTPFEAELVDAATLMPAVARLSVTNAAALPAGSSVEWVALGSYLFADWVKPAAFEVVATGTVSADGTRIEMDAGAGVRHLTWVGVRPKP